jgi:hypothetical protein
MIRAAASVLIFLSVAQASSISVLIFGESFRENSHEGSRSFGPGGLQAQKEATLSQVVFVFYTLVFELGYTVKLHVCTQKSGLERELERWYAPYSTSFVANASYDGMRYADFVREKLSDSDEAVLFFRPDMVFKPVTPSALAAVDKTKIFFPFELGPELVGVDAAGKQIHERRVCDQLTWVPRAYFQQLLDAPEHYIRSHWSPNFITRHVPGGLDRMTFLLPREVANSNPEKERNRIFRLAGRSEPADYDFYYFRGPRTERFCNTTFDSLLHV